ncbi:hypothetical protein AB205_0021180 [Aquarana catesbeiana]|uniref:Myb/SANT-like DNA-binding domain-containing protein n=1 Tax=Aquarana catesbeiana TaxID=8400 RepID=A0A2G9RK45_AQUCT|nr:hypothetical protein AB205_0021180 [Aquarana catesbeiana]
MAERLSASSAEESPEPQPSRSRRRYKATNMAFEEMVEMVSILRREDYDGKKGPYTQPNMRKDKIMSSVVTALDQKFGTKRAKEQLRKWWSDLKSREPEQYWRIKKLLKKSKYLLCVPNEILNLHADPYAFRLYSIVRKGRSFENTYDTKKITFFIFCQIRWCRVVHTFRS